MASVNCTNRVAQPALKGQSVPIILNGAESLSILPVLVLGQSVLSESSTATGTIDFIDLKGHSFRVKPKQMNTQFNSGTIGQLSVNELITITV